MAYSKAFYRTVENRDKIYAYKKEFFDEESGELYEEDKYSPKSDDELVVYTIDITSKTIEVLLSGQFPLQKYRIIGTTSFKDIVGTYKKSGQFTGDVYYILKQLLENIENISSFTVDKNRNAISKISKKRNGKIDLILAYDDYHKIYQINTTQKVIGNNSAFKDVATIINEIAKEDLIETSDDITGLLTSAFKKEISQDYIKNLKKKDKLRLLFDLYEKAIEEGTIDETAFIFKKSNSYKIDWIINEYKNHLDNYSSDELEWQKFLEETFTFINPIYKYIIREVDTIFEFGDETATSRPIDFIVVDLYNNIELIEIKTPSANLLSKRKDHNNYYLQSNCTKACTQLEKYLMCFEQNTNGMIKKLKKKISEKYKIVQKDIKLNFTRPKANLIIGQVSDLYAESEKYNDFQLQRRAFKNIEIVTFDEIYNSLTELRDELLKRDTL